MTDQQHTVRRRIAINPLPWVFPSADFSFGTRKNWDIAARFHAGLGYEAMVLAEATDEVEGSLADRFDRFGLIPAPGYLGVSADQPQSQRIAQTRAAARQHRKFGLSEMFLALRSVPERRAHPAEGVLADPDRTGRLAVALAELAGVAHDEGVTAAFHPHTGSWIETESETRQVLDATAGSALAFGPDIGHLTWAGADVMSLFSDYSHRIAGVHVKDVALAQVQAARRVGADYRSATVDHHVWTEPTRGDADFAGILDLLPADFTGWFIVEVDEPSLPTREESSRFALEVTATL